MELTGKKIYIDYFDLYIPVKNQVLFEHELINQKIDFYFDEIYYMPGNYLRYYLKKIDFEKVDNLLVKNNLTANTRLTGFNDFDDGKKLMGIYLKVAAIVILLFIIVVFIMSLSR